MQNGSLTLNGSGAATVVAPCPCEAVDIYSIAHTFSFQYANANDNDANVGNPQGAVAPALQQQAAATFLFRAESGRDLPWGAGQTIGFITGGTSADTIYVVPKRTGGK
jgi:hypothetical protein